jgi:hypothetical protein
MSAYDFKHLAKISKVMHNSIPEPIEKRISHIQSLTRELDFLASAYKKTLDVSKLQRVLGNLILTSVNICWEMDFDLKRVLIQALDEQTKFLGK